MSVQKYAIKQVVFWSLLGERKNVIKMQQILGDFYPVYRKGLFGGPFCSKLNKNKCFLSEPKSSMKIMIFLIVFRERRNVIKMHEILGDFYPVYRKGPFGVIFCPRTGSNNCFWEKILDGNSDILTSAKRLENACKAVKLRQFGALFYSKLQ